MFKVGDAVVHPTKGAGIITGIRRMPGLKKKRQCYRIKMVDERAKTVLMISVEKADETGLRPAISASHLDRVWRTLSNLPHELPMEHKERYKLLKEKLQTGRVTQVAEVIRDLEWRKMSIDKKALNVPGQRIYRKAMRLLAGELAVSQDIDFQMAEAQVRELLDKSLEPAAA